MILEEGGGQRRCPVFVDMDATRLAEILIDLLEEHVADRDDAGLPVSELTGADVDTFGDAGVPTDDAGFVVTLRDGTELQVTVIRTRN